MMMKHLLFALIVLTLCLVSAVGPADPAVATPTTEPDDGGRIKVTLSTTSGVASPSWTITEKHVVDEMHTLIRKARPTDQAFAPGLGYGGFVLQAHNLPGFPEFAWVLEDVVQIVNDGRVEYRAAPQKLSQLLLEQARQHGAAERLESGQETKGPARLNLERRFELLLELLESKGVLEKNEFQRALEQEIRNSD